MSSGALQGNREISGDLLSSVEATITAGGPPQRIIECGPLEVNLFSICFWATLMGPAGTKQVYVKIPKVIFYEKEKENLTSFSAEDVKLAEDEYKSLSYLSRHWDGFDTDVKFVTPLGFVEEFNAIITERVMARHFFRQYRKTDLSRRLLSHAPSDPVLEGMSRLGTALAQFHKRSQDVVVCDTDTILEKMQGYLLKLRNSGVDGAYLDDIARRLVGLRKVKFTSRSVVNLKGLDIRQVFLDQDNGLHLLDPGKMKDGYREVDLARFIVTCKILYWGSSAILFHVTPSAKYEKSFLTAYRQSNGISEMALGVLIVKEVLKHWIMAHTSMEKREWPWAYKMLLNKVYVNSFYKRLLSVEMSKSEAFSEL
jgi:hypothetical protein